MAFASFQSHRHLVLGVDIGDIYLDTHHRRVTVQTRFQPDVMNFGIRQIKLADASGNGEHMRKREREAALARQHLQIKTKLLKTGSALEHRRQRQLAIACLDDRLASALEHGAHRLYIVLDVLLR